MNKIKNEIFRVTGIMLLFSVLIVGGAQSQTINSCTTINASGEYVLNQDILNSSNNVCIDITASNVIFNGAGHVIDGSGASPNGTKGIIVTGFNNVTVENTILTNWEFDILYYGVNAGNIIGNNVSLANYSIYLESSANNLVKSNNVNSNNVYGIWIGKGQNSSMVNSSNLLVENTITRNAFGVYIDTVGNNTLNNNLVLNNGIGVYSTSSPSNTIDDNNISNNNLSIELALSNFNTVKNNNMSSFVGMTLNSSSGNTIYNNYFNNVFNAADDGNNSWNITKTLGTNIIGGPYLGGNFWSDYTGNDTSGDRLGDTLLPYNNAGKIKNGGDFLPLTMSLGMVENVTGNITVTSDPDNISTSPSNPVIIYVTSPNPGLVTIQISPTTQSAPSGFSFLNQQIDITAPSTNSSSPLIIVFTISSTQIPSGQNESTIQIFKNGTINGTIFNGTVPPCSGSGATPDPCVSVRTKLANGDIQITVLSSNGDPWNIGIPAPTPMPTTTPFPTPTPPPEPKGNIAGIKFEDKNANHEFDIGESGLPNWTIVLTNDDTGNKTNQTTISDGSYNFKNLIDGNYTVGEVLQSGWIQTFPRNSTHKLQISGGNVVRVTNNTSADFGNFKLGEIHGTKFEDLNANGTKDTGEKGLQGWQININGMDTITNTIVNNTTTTDKNGDYNFTGLTNGTYIITETGQNGWVQSTPATGKYTVNITSGAAITKQDFGNFHKGKITGGGWISIKGDPKATFGIDGQYPGGKTAQGNVEYQDHKANLNIKSIQINTVATTLDNKKGAITGLAQVNGVGSYPFVVYVEDNGEPGKGIDVFNISLPTYKYSNGAILSGGNIQIHS
jgi:parallel beta-helix repeat protein